MKPQPNKEHWRSGGEFSDLPRIEQCVLDHVQRYRLTTRRGWRGAWELRLFDDWAISRAVRRLIRRKALSARILYGSTHVFELTQIGAKLLGLPDERARPLSEKASIRAFGQLLFATTGSQPWILLESKHGRSPLCSSLKPIQKVQPNLSAWGIFADPTDLDHYCRLWVDRSFTTRPNRIAQRLHRSALKLEQYLLRQNNIGHEQFTLAVITPSRRRAQWIQKRYSRYGHDSLSLRLMVAPALIPLLRRN